MNTKLTLSLSKHIIENAKNYAKSHQISLSQLIENYLSSLTRKQEKEQRVSLLVKSLTGIIPNEEAVNYKNDYYDYLNEKYA